MHLPVRPDRGRARAAVCRWTCSAGLRSARFTPARWRRWADDPAHGAALLAERWIRPVARRRDPRRSEADVQHVPRAARLVAAQAVRTARRAAACSTRARSRRCSRRRSTSRASAGTWRPGGCRRCRSPRPTSAPGAPASSSRSGPAARPSWEGGHQRALPVALGPAHALASASIPFLFPAVAIGSELYCDGSLRQHVPLSPARHLGAHALVAVNPRAPRIGDERGGGDERRRGRACRRGGRAPTATGLSGPALSARARP